MARAMALPAGTVTLLFSDIEGSTRLLDSLGERYARVLDAHRAIVRGAVAQHGGEGGAHQERRCVLRGVRARWRCRPRGGRGAAGTRGVRPRLGSEVRVKDGAAHG